MEDELRKNLPADIERFQSQDFLEAAMAVCALASYADNKVSFPERLKIDEIIAKEPALSSVDAAKANDILDGYIRMLRQESVEGEVANAMLSEKVSRVAGDQDKSQTLMCVAYLVIGADHDIHPREKSEFDRLCGLLGLDVDQVWRELAA